MYITGSRAIRHWFPDFPRDPVDLDFFVNDKGLKSPNTPDKIEYLYNPIICQKMEKGGHEQYVPPRMLLTNLMSHIFWQDDYKSFEKHMFSIQFLLDKGVKFDKELFYELYEWWPEIHGKNRRSDLNLSSDVFFNNAINPGQVVSHDELHYLILEEGQEPAYKQILIGEVLTCDEKFDNLPHKEKIKIIQEESIAMAFERYKGTLPAVRYLKQLRKMITGHLTIEEAIFAIVNYKELTSLAKDAKFYWNRVNQKLKDRGLNELI